MKSKGKHKTTRNLSPAQRRLFRLCVLLKIAELLKERRREHKSATEKKAEAALRRFAGEVIR